MSQVTRGLHCCKPQNTPRVGQVKSFVLETKNPGTDREWIKIRNVKPEEGSYFSIVSVEKTNWSDERGNISFNLEIEPSDAPPPQQQQQTPQNAPQSSGNGSPARSAPAGGSDSVEQHIARSANLYALVFRKAATHIRDTAQRLNLELSTSDIKEIATTLYIDAKNAGFISHMPDTEQKKEPF